MNIKITSKSFEKKPPAGPLRQAYERAAMAVPLWLLETQTGISGLKSAFYASARSGKPETISCAANDAGSWSLDVTALEPTMRGQTYGVRLGIHEDSSQMKGDLMSRDFYRGSGVRGFSLERYYDSTIEEERQGLQQQRMPAAETVPIRNFVNWFTAKPL